MFVYYSVVLISWMGTKKLFLGNLWIFLLFFGLLTFSQWIGIIHGSHAKQWHPCNRVHNEPNEEGNVGILETGMGMSHEEGH